MGCEFFRQKLCPIPYRSMVVTKARVIAFLLSSLIFGALAGCEMSGSPSIDAEPFVMERGVFAPRISFASPPEDRLSVRIGFAVDDRGRAVNAEIVQSSGVRGLDVAALRSVRETRFDVETPLERRLYLDFGLKDRHLPPP